MIDGRIQIMPVKWVYPVNWSLVSPPLSQSCYNE